MNPGLLADFKLLFVVCLAGVVALLGTVNVAARPAAILTGRVALAFTVSQVFFMVSRFANMFYLPLMASFVDQATRTGHTEHLLGQIRWVIVGSALGALLSAVLLPQFVSLYCLGIRKMDEKKSMVRVIFWAVNPLHWGEVVQALLKPPSLGARLFKLEGIPQDFLWFNIAATAIWTVGALSAIYVSALFPQFKATAVLLSGLVNAFAAIAFSVWVDPRAALITDQARSGQRPPEQVYAAALHLAVGNFVGAALGLLVLHPGIMLVGKAALALGASGGELAGSLWAIVALNALFMLLASTTYASRVSAVITGRVATAISVYNLFFLITRLAGQVYAPILGSVSDHLVSQGTSGLSHLEAIFRWVLAGASLGALLGLLLMPTFVEVYTLAIRQLDRRGSIPAVLLAAAHPSSWGRIVGCLRPPSLFGVRLRDLRQIPNAFLVGNVLVLSIHTVGVMAAIFAGAQLSHELARTATLLSSVVNGLATITLSIVVDPMCSLITDQTVAQERPQQHIRIMAVFLMVSMLVGTLLSQLIFIPASYVIMLGARILDAVF